MLHMKASVGDIAKLELRLRWLAGDFTDDYLERRRIARVALESILGKDPDLAFCSMGPRQLREELSEAVAARRALLGGRFPARTGEQTPAAGLET